MLIVNFGWQMTPYCLDLLEQWTTETLNIVCLLQIGRSYVISKLKDYPQFQTIDLAVHKSGFKVPIVLHDPFFDSLVGQQTCRLCIDYIFLLLCKFFVCSFTSAFLFIWGSVMYKESDNAWDWYISVPADCVASSTCTFAAIQCDELLAVCYTN